MKAVWALFLPSFPSNLPSLFLSLYFEWLQDVYPYLRLPCTYLVASFLYLFLHFVSTLLRYKYLCTLAAHYLSSLFLCLIIRNLVCASLTWKEAQPMSPCTALFVVLLWEPNANRPTAQWLTYRLSKICDFKHKYRILQLFVGKCQC